MIMIIIIKMWMNEYEAPGFDMLEPGVLGVFFLFALEKTL